MNPSNRGQQPKLASCKELALAPLFSEQVLPFASRPSLPARIWNLFSACVFAVGWTLSGPVAAAAIIRRHFSGARTITIVVQ